MYARWTLPIVAILLISAESLPQAAVRLKFQELQGTWTLKWGEGQGKRREIGPTENGLIMIVKGDKAVFKVHVAPGLDDLELAEATLRIDATVKPKSLDVISKRVDKAGPMELVGIYKLECGALWICGRIYSVAEIDARRRPTEFKTEKEDTRLGLFVFRRDRP